MISKQSAANIVRFIQNIWDSTGMYYPQELIQKYRDILMSCSDIDILSTTMVFQHDFHFANEWFTLYWDVHRMLEERDRWPSKRIPVSDCLQRVSLQELDAAKVETYARAFPNEPILIAEIPFSDMGYCVVDGNHRVAAASRAGLNFIDSIWLFYDCHPLFMSENSKLLFAACCDLQYLTNYFMGKITFEECASRCLFK